MPRRRPPHRCLPTLLALTLTLCAGPVWSQLTIPGELVVAQQRYTVDQEEQIRRPVQGWLDDIASADPKRVGPARESLISQINRAPPGQGQVFLPYYATLIGQQLPVLVQARQPDLARLNAMIVAERLASVQQSDQMAQAVTVALTDANPAVRYWAAKAAGNLVSRGQLPVPLLVPMLAALSNAIGQEQSDPVWQVQMSTLAAMPQNDAGAQNVLLTELANRVNVLAASPTRSPASVDRPLRQLYQQLAASPSASPALARQLAAVSFRYLTLASRHLNREDLVLEDAQRTDLAELASLADAVLRWAAGQLEAPADQLPRSAKDIAANKSRWLELPLITADWQRLLVAAPFNLTEADLAVRFEP